MTNYDNDILIADIKLKGAVPENDQWTDANILKLANEVIKDTLLPLIIKLREEYYVYPDAISATASTAKYRVNKRFIGGMYRDVQLVDGNNLISLPNIPAEDAASTATGTPRAFYMQGNNLVLYPTPDRAFTVQASGFIRPSLLAETANCGQIASIDTNNNQVTVDAIPSGWTTGTVVDFVKGSANYEILSIDSSITNASGVTLTFASLPTGLEVGDYIAPQGYSPVPNIPEDFMSILTEYSVAKVLKSMGYNDEAQVAMESAAALLKNTLEMLKPRVQGAPRKFKSRLV